MDSDISIGLDTTDINYLQTQQAQPTDIDIVTTSANALTPEANSESSNAFILSPNCNGFSGELISDSACPDHILQNHFVQVTHHNSIGIVTGDAVEQKEMVSTNSDSCLLSYTNSTPKMMTSTAAEGEVDICNIGNIGNVNPFPFTVDSIITVPNAHNVLTTNAL